MNDNTSKIELSSLPDYKLDVIKKILSTNFTNSKTKLSDEAINLVNEVLKAMVCEMSLRTIKQAQNDSVTNVKISQVETILPQIMMDFP